MQLLIVLSQRIIFVYNYLYNYIERVIDKTLSKLQHIVSFV